MIQTARPSLLLLAERSTEWLQNFTMPYSTRQEQLRVRDFLPCRRGSLLDTTCLTKGSCTDVPGGAFKPDVHAQTVGPQTYPNPSKCKLCIHAVHRYMG